MKRFIALALLSALSVPTLPAGQLQAAPEMQAVARPRAYEKMVQDVANMVSDQRAWRLLRKRGLNILNVLWEDTGRYLGSSVGPNISDVTIEVQVEGRHGLHNYLMPVIRYPNFTDKTADIDIDQFFVRVGNHEEGAPLETVSLRELLASPEHYMSLPGQGKIKGGSLLAKRDSHVLVSAQHAFLPVPQGGRATFYPVIFNYQSYAENPAVLTILVTRQGTSMTIVDNQRDTISGAGSWGQRLFFNKGGQRAPLTAERLTDVRQAGQTANGESADSLGQDSNLLMIIQVPLKRKALPRATKGLEADFEAAAPAAAGAPGMRSRGGASDMDTAVLGHGAVEGPYTELDGLTIERDPRFPVRVTVQFYQATSNGVIDAEDLASMAAQIDKVYARADYVGSLVVPDGNVDRPTQWTGTSQAPQDLGWHDFPGLVERYEQYGFDDLRPLWHVFGL